MKFKKGSKEAKDFMAKLRASRGKKKAVKKSKVGAVKRSARKVVVKQKGAVLGSTHNDTKSHNYKISISGADSYMNGVNDYIKQVQKRIAIFEKEISATDKAVKEQKNPLIKKSLINRRTFLRSELRIGKQFFKKHI